MTQLYNTIINDISKIVKKSIIEAFSFDSMQNNKNKEIIKKTTEIVQNYIPVSKILNTLNIPLMRGAKDDKDKNDVPVYWYGTKKKLRPWEDCSQIEEYKRILTGTYKWQYLDRKSETGIQILKSLGLYERLADPMVRDGFRCFLVSPDNGLLLLQYDVNDFEKDGVRYTYAFEIKRTGLVNYTPSDKKAQKIEYNSGGQPLTRYDEEEAFEMYMEMLRIVKDLNEYDVPYNNAYWDYSDMLEKKYKLKPSDFTSDARKQYDRDMAAWEKEARETYKLNSNEYQDLMFRFNALKKKMKDSLTAKELEKTWRVRRGQRGLTIQQIFKNKYCPDRKVSYVDL